MSVCAAEKKTKKKDRELRWLSKSDQFVIYQDRKITKTNQFLASFSVARHRLNGISKNNDLTFDGSYYWNETNGMGAYVVFSFDSLEDSIESRSDSDLIFRNNSKYQVGIKYDWVPLYGKHLYKRKVIYTDIGLSAGLGLSSYEHNGNALANSNSELNFESATAFDFRFVGFLRVFLENKYFLKISIQFRNTEIQEANELNQELSGTSRQFVNNTAFAVGMKL